METSTSEKPYRSYFAAALVILIFAIASVLAIMWISPFNKATTESVFPTKEGVEPYRFTKHESELLDLIKLNGSVALLRIKAPKEVGYLTFQIHTLKDDGSWDTSATGSDMSWGDDPNCSGQLEGTLALTRRGDYSIQTEFGYGIGVKRSVKDIPAPELSFDPHAGTLGFLRQLQPIELYKEIPIAFLALNKEGEIPILTLQDYYDPSNLTGYDFVQIVTMTFRADP